MFPLFDCHADAEAITVETACQQFSDGKQAVPRPRDGEQQRLNLLPTARMRSGLWTYGRPDFL
jgi:hypothetical protein